MVKNIAVEMGLKPGIAKIIIVFALITISLVAYIWIYVLPQVPMMTLGYQYDADPLNSNSFYNFDIRFSGSVTYFAYCDENGINAYRSEDDGYTWVNILSDPSAPSVPSGNHYRMDVYGDIIGIIYEIDDLSNYYFVYSMNKGDNWSLPIEVPIERPGYFDSIAFINSTYLIANYNNATWVGHSTTIYLSKNLGLNWESQPTSPSFHGIYDIRVTQNKTIYMCGVSTMYAYNHSIFRSSDLGKTWSEIETNFFYVRLIKGSGNSFYIISKVNGYAEDGLNVIIYKSTDECKTWSKGEFLDTRVGYIESNFININQNDEIFIVYEAEIQKLSLFHSYSVGIYYYWIGRDIWIERYVNYFFNFFVPPFLISLVIFPLFLFYSWKKYKHSLAKLIESKNNSKMIGIKIPNQPNIDGKLRRCYKCGGLIPNEDRCCINCGYRIE